MPASLIADFVSRVWCPAADAELGVLDLDHVWQAAEGARADLAAAGQATQGLGPPLLFHLRLAEQTPWADEAARGRPPAAAREPVARAAAAKGAKHAGGQVGAKGVAGWGKMAIHDVGHRKMSEALLGQSYSGVHRFIDRAAGGHHRWIGHSLGDIAKVGKRFAGRSGGFNRKAATAAAQHIFQDFFTTRGIPLVSKQTAERLSGTYLFRVVGANTAAKVSEVLALNFLRSVSIVMWAWCAYDVFRIVRDVRTGKVIAAAYEDLDAGRPEAALTRMQTAPVVNRGWRWQRARGEVHQAIALRAAEQGHRASATLHIGRAIEDLTAARNACRTKETVTVPWPGASGANRRTPRMAVSARGLIGLSVIRCQRIRDSLDGTGRNWGALAQDVASDFLGLAQAKWDAPFGRHVASAVQNQLYAAEAYLAADAAASSGFSECMGACAGRLALAVEEYAASGDEDAQDLWRSELPRAEALTALASAMGARSPSEAAQALEDLVTLLPRTSPSSVSELRGWQRGVELAIGSLWPDGDCDTAPTSADVLPAAAQALSALPTGSPPWQRSTAWRTEAARALLAAGELTDRLDDAVSMYERAASHLSIGEEHLHAAQALNTTLAYVQDHGPEPGHRLRLEQAVDGSLNAALQHVAAPQAAQAPGHRAELGWYVAHVRLAQARRARSGRAIAKAVRGLVAAGDALIGQDACILSRSAAGLVGTGTDAAMTAYLEALSAAEAALDERLLSARTVAGLRRQAIDGMAVALG